jgi:hypothetical protein
MTFAERVSYIRQRRRMEVPDATAAISTPGVTSVNVDPGAGIFRAPNTSLGEPGSARDGVC